jgi:hypothetical protein
MFPMVLPSTGMGCVSFCWRTPLRHTGNLEIPFARTGAVDCREYLFKVVGTIRLVNAGLAIDTVLLAVLTGAWF